MTIRWTTALLVSTLTTAATAQSLTLQSPDFKSGQYLQKAQVFNGFGCTGDNASPALKWGPLPQGTKSVAVTVFDPDAPTGSGWWHWLIYDLSAQTTGLPANAGVEGNAAMYGNASVGRNDFGSYGFGGACPPPGSEPHHYVFTVYALKVERLELPPTPSAAMISYSLRANSLATAQITALYRR